MPSKRLASILDSSITGEEEEKGKDFDYYLQKSMNESSLATSAAAVAVPASTKTKTVLNEKKAAAMTTATSTGGRVKRLSAMKAMENIQDVDLDEEEQTRRKYDRLAGKKG